jgi:hypothetical protein
VQLHHQVHGVAAGLADQAEGFQAFGDLLRRDAHAAIGEGGAVEGPDLHAGDTFGQQRTRQLHRVVFEGMQIVQRVARGFIDIPHAEPLVHVAALGTLHIGRARAGVVDADGGPRQPAQQRMQRQAAALAQAVPQRDVHGRGRAHFHARGGIAHAVPHQLRVDRTDVAGVLAQQQRRDRLVQVLLHRAGREESLAQARDAGVGLDAQPDQVLMVGRAQRLDRRDDHARHPGRTGLRAGNCVIGRYLLCACRGWHSVPLTI